MPPYYHAPVVPRTSGRRINSSSNALGYDPDGRVAHLVQHLFGPWVPHVIRRARFTGQYHAPPRYGPPTADQLPWLPITFVPQNPPPYYGSPRAPYLPPPPLYDATVFSALTSRPRRRQIDAADLVEAVPGGAHYSLGLFYEGHSRPFLCLVWSFRVVYWIGPVAHDFSVRTNLDWNLFQRLAQIYLGIMASDKRIGYRVIRGGNLEALCYFRGSGDWESVLGGIRIAAGEGRYEAIEISNASVLTLYTSVDTDGAHFSLRKCMA